MKKLGFGLIWMLVILSSGIGFIYFSEGVDAFSTQMEDIYKDQSIEGEAIKRIIVKADSTDVKLESHNSATIEMELKGQVSEKMKNAFDLTFEEHGDLLQIEVERKMKPSFTLFAINKGTLLTIRVPKKLFEELSVATSSGDIQAKNLSVSDLAFEATSGDMKVERVASKKAHLLSTSGDIYAEGLEATGKLSIEATSGDIHSIRSNGRTMHMIATSGDVSIEGISDSLSIDFQGGEGTVDVPGFLFEEKSEERIIGKIGKGEASLKVRTTSGDFSLK
jgi:lia operon protein LiaG